MMLTRCLRHADDEKNELKWRLGALVLLAMLATWNDACATSEVTGGDPDRGRRLIREYGCVACHAIPGIPHHGSNVGPPLTKIGKRAYIGGILPNMPEQMVRWLRNPPAVDPQTVMPNLGISEAEARDMASYLYTLK